MSVRGKRREVMILACALIIFLMSMLIVNATMTGGFSVKKKSVEFVTDDGVSMTGTLFVPKTASKDNPAAGVVVAPGGNTPGQFYASFELELARRGYVVFSYNYYGTAGSEMSMTGNSGADAAMKYLSDLSFVDENRLAAIGHSNGGMQASAAITGEAASGAQKRSVVFIGCGIPEADPASYDNINLMTVWGKLDECGQGVFWDVVHTDSLNFSTFADLVGLESGAVEVGKMYGTANDNSLRVVYTPNTFHMLSNLIPSTVSQICNFMDMTLGGNVTGIEVNSLIYIWQEIFLHVAALSLCIMIFPVGSLVLDTKYFGTLKKEVKETDAKLGLVNWAFVLIPGVLSAFIVKTTVMQGQTILGMCPKIFNVQSTSGFVWWFLLSAIICLIAQGIRTFIDKGYDIKANMSGLKTTVSDLFKAVVFSLITVSVPYLFSMFIQGMTGAFARIFQTNFAALTSDRVWMFVVYYVVFGVLFAVYACLQSEVLRIKGGSEGKNYLITFVTNALPAVLFLGMLYGKLIITHVTPIDGREMSRAQGAMMGMVLLYFVIAKVVTYFYKKTGNIYVVALTNAAFITWVSVNTQQLVV